jgi:putative ABC transport system substrate-binding protein
MADEHKLPAQIAARALAPAGQSGSLVARGVEAIKNRQQALVLSGVEADAKKSFLEGVAAEKRGDYAEAVKWYRKAADQGYAEAQLNLAITIVARAAAAVTTTVPIVMVGAADPFAGGLVKSLSHPGGNVTGFSSLDIDIAGKVFEVLKEMVPGLKRIAVLATRTIWTLFAPTQDQAAKVLGVELSYIDMPQPEAAGAAMRQALAAGAQGAVVRGGPFFSAVQRRVIIDSAAELRLPVIYERRDDAAQGGLVSYSADHLELYRATAGYVARILAGESAGDLPVQQPTKFEFVINLKTANALGLNIPASLLARADEVIE